MRTLMVALLSLARLLSSTASKMQRVERIISNRGAGSRNEVSRLIAQGRVRNAKGEVVRSGADKYLVDAPLFVDEQELLRAPLLACYNKPVGVHSAMGDDKWGRDNLETLSAEHSFLRGMHPVGRLDADTSGLLLFSADGKLTQLLLHPSTGVVRQYEALVVGEVQHDQLATTLRSGVQTSEGVFPADLVHSRVMSKTSAPPSPSAPLPDADELEGLLELMEEDERFAPADSARSMVRVCVTEGKYRMVRRVLHNAGHSVVELRRLRYGDIELGELAEGAVRRCSLDEEAWAEALRASKGK